MSVYAPTNLDWVIAEGCVCAAPNAICLRPSEFTKPVECVHRDHAQTFADHLLEPRCNVTEFMQQLSNNGDGTLFALIIILMFGVLFVQVKKFLIFFTF